MESIFLYDKYEIRTNNQPFELKVLKDGKEWRNLTGDDLIHIMFLRIKELERKEEVCKKQHTKGISNRYKNVKEVSACGVGILGEGEYKTYSKNEKSKRSPQYSRWISMLSRCYTPKIKLMKPSYMECTVCDEWHNFQNFAKWHDENYYEIEGEVMHLDKDILIKDNRYYSPETCIFVPAKISMMITRSNERNRTLPVGVTFVAKRKKKKYRAICSHKTLGYFNTPEEAYQEYKLHKEKLVKETADMYKGKIPDKIYKAMYDFRVSDFDL